MPVKKSVFHWSGGKDSSIALQRILQNPEYSVDCLLTTVNRAHDRITMHGVRRDLLEAQVAKMDIPLEILELPEQPDMEEYNRLFGDKMYGLKERGITHAIYGDIFLEDLKSYRENLMEKLGFESVFPIWKEDTTDLIHQFIDEGFKAITVCFKDDLLGKDFVGRVINKSFIDELPKRVDPCGENGEFHTFVYDGPIFSSSIPFKKGNIVYREYDSPSQPDSDVHQPENSKMGFWFCDLLPKIV